MSALTMLVIGDSILWGQGLLEGDKSSTLVQQQLQAALHREVARSQVLAHSGACIAPDAVKDAAPAFWGEVPSFYPSITAQIAAAARDFRDVDLVLLDGGSNDLGVRRLVNPLERGATIYADGQKYCGQPMRDLLGSALAAFPRAGVVVTGYYPIVSNMSGPGGIQHVLQACKLQGIWEQMAASMLEDFEESTLFLLLRQKLANLSTAWADGSTLALRAAVAAANQAEVSQGRAPRVVFAPVVFQPENCLECAATFLWIGIDDDQYAARERYCAQPLPAGIDWPTLMEIPIASVGHPNRAGAGAYAASVMQALAPWIAAGAWNPGTAPEPPARLEAWVENAPLMQPNQPVEARVTVRAQDAQTKRPVSGVAEMTNHDETRSARFPLNQPFTWMFHAHTFAVGDQGTAETTTRVRVLADGYDPVWVRW